MDGGHHEVEEKVGAVDVEREEAPGQEGDLHHLGQPALVEPGGESEVQQGGQGEDDPALGPAWE